MVAAKAGDGRPWPWPWPWPWGAGGPEDHLLLLVLPILDRCHPTQACPGCLYGVSRSAISAGARAGSSRIAAKVLGG